VRKFRSEYVGEVFVLYRGQRLDEVLPKTKVETRILALRSLTDDLIRQIIALQGRLAFGYLRIVFGSAKTYVALALAEGRLVHISLVTPGRICRRRQPIIPKEAYMIGPSHTALAFRGNRIFPFVLQQIARAVAGCNEFWILVNEANIASIRAIEKAGARHVGRYIQKRWLWGLYAHTKFVAD